MDCKTQREQGNVFNAPLTIKILFLVFSYFFVLTGLKAKYVYAFNLSKNGSSIDLLFYSNKVNTTFFDGGDNYFMASL